VFAFSFITIKEFDVVSQLGMLMGLDFPGSRKNFPFPGQKIPERENFGKLRTIHHYKLPWQQFVIQWTPHNGHCLTPGGVRCAVISFTIAAGVC